MPSYSHLAFKTISSLSPILHLLQASYQNDSILLFFLSLIPFHPPRHHSLIYSHHYLPAKLSFSLLRSNLPSPIILQLSSFHTIPYHVSHWLFSEILMYNLQEMYSISLIQLLLIQVLLNDTDYLHSNQVFLKLQVSNSMVNNLV